MDSVRSFDTKAALLEGLGTATLDSLSASIYLEKDDAALTSAAGPLGKARVRVVRHLADEWVVATEGPRPSVLVVTNSYNPFWRAYVDRKPAKVLPAYHAFQAVVVPAGTHEVVLRYEPPYRFPRER